MAATPARRRSPNPCWRGKDDPGPFAAGKPETVPEPPTLASLFDAMVCCTRCDLARGRTQVVRGIGPPDARLMLVGEAPGAQEDREGRPFVGRAGRLLDRLLADHGIERETVFITNVVACRPQGNRTPRVREVKAHADWLDQQLRLVDPDVIVTLGRVALNYFLPGAKVTEARGRPAEIARDGRTRLLLPVLHPAAALRRREVLPDMERDFARIPELLARSARSR